MKKKMIFLLLIAALAATVWFNDVRDYLSFKHLKERRDTLQRVVDGHYFLSVAVIIAIFISTAFFVPGALVLTIAEGFLFGVIPGTVYVNIGSVTGSLLAFLSSRFLFGDRIQNNYQAQLKYFNKEVEKHGNNYLFVLRIFRSSLSFS